MEAAVTHLNRDLRVYYTLDGKYYPATRETPEEYPDVIVTEVYYDGRNITKALDRMDKVFKTDNIGDITEKIINQ